MVGHDILRGAGIVSLAAAGKLVFHIFRDFFASRHLKTTGKPTF